MFSKILLQLWVFPMLEALSATLPLNLTNLGSYSKPAPESLQLHPLPNPFHIPGTDIILQWYEGPHLDSPLPIAATQAAFLECKTKADNHVRYIGDGPIRGLFPNHLITVHQNVVVEFVNDVPGVILFSEVPVILMAISWKMSSEGYRNCWVRVLRSDEGALGEILGTVSVREAM